MDSLALLCNLYGEGPVTLRRLREAGCRACDDIARLEPGELARILRAQRGAAERFQREARELAARAVSLEEPGPQLAQAQALSTSPSEGNALRPELLDGLDLAVCVRLREQGVDSVEDLARVEPLELARSMDAGVTRVMRLQFLARRWLEERRAAAPESGLRERTLVPLRSELSAARFSPSEEAGEAQAAAGAEPEFEHWLEAREKALPEGSSGPFA